MRIRDYITIKLLQFAGDYTLSKPGQFVVKSDGNAYVFVGGVETALSTGGGGGGAPTNAQYLTLATNVTLTQERTLSLSAPLSGSDGGAGSAYTLSVSGWSGTTDGDMLYRNGTAVGTKTPAQARTWLDLGTYYQPLDADLTAYAALSSTGLVVRTGAGTVATATITTPLALTGSTLSVGAASTSAAGVVELANDGEETAGLAVQASDSRLAAAPSLWSSWGHVQPRGTVSPPSYDGRGALSAQGIHSVSVAEPNFPAFRLGDTAANACRFTIVGAFRLDEGAWVIDYVFKLGSDISATQSCWIGMFNGTTLDSADPATSQRAALRYTAGTDTNWSISTKDGTTPNNVDSGVAVTASYYYVVRLRLTTTTYTAQIGRGSTLAAAILDFASFTPVANNSNLPGSTTDLQIISSCYRASVTTANRSIISGPMLWRCDL